MAEATKMPVNVEKGKTAGPAEWRPFAEPAPSRSTGCSTISIGARGAGSHSRAALFDVEPFWRGETGWGVACLPSTSPRRRRNTR